MSDKKTGLFDFSDEYDALEDARNLAQENSGLRAEIERLKDQSRILRDKLETANWTIKRLESNQIPEMDDLSHNARAAFYKSILPKRLIEAWQSASDVLDGKGGDWKASLTSVYERLDDILAEFELF